jgi:seryl-tRNA synthetase
MPNNSKIRQWADELDRLLQKAVMVRASEDPTRIAAVQKELRKFKEDSPDYADALDTQASLAIFDLDLSVTEDAVAKLKERAAEVYRLTKLIEGISEEANTNANVLSGAILTQAIDAATSAISSLKKLREELSATKANEKRIAAEIDQVLPVIQGLRNKLENP